MSLKGKWVYVKTGINKGAYGLVTHADRDSLRIALNPRDLLEIGVFDRIENVVKSDRESKS